MVFLKPCAPVSTCFHNMFAFLHLRNSRRYVTILHPILPHNAQSYLLHFSTSWVQGSQEWSSVWDGAVDRHTDSLSHRYRKMCLCSKASGEGRKCQGVQVPSKVLRVVKEGQWVYSRVQYKQKPRGVWGVR